MTNFVRRFWLAALVVLAVGAGTVSGAIPQDPAYHSFADARACLGTANCANVWSNLPFMLVGLYGLAEMVWAIRRGQFAGPWDAAPYFVFFLAVAAISAGSAFYHISPDTHRLYWDRLPIAVAFAALLAGFLRDRLPRLGRQWLILPALVALGVASLLYWDWTEQMGRGDLRFYAAVQFAPMLVIPLLCLLYPRGSHTDGRFVIPVAGCYGLAKLLERFDLEIYDALGQTLSGHTLKHLAAALAVYFVLAMVRRANTSPPNPTQ